MLKNIILIFEFLQYFIIYIYQIKDLKASNGPLISQGINERRLKRNKNE
jgi:hypothetical protein